MQESDSQSVSHRSTRGVFTSTNYSARLSAQKSKRLSYITELDLFKLAAINLPRHTIVQAMPVSLQVESTEINRMRSHYIKMILAVWRSYARNVFGYTCPVFGTYTKVGDLYPSSELAEIVGLESQQPTDLEQYPPLNLTPIAKDSNTTEQVVSSILKLIFSTCRNIITKRWFQKIKLQLSSAYALVITKGTISIQKLSVTGEKIPQK